VAGQQLSSPLSRVAPTPCSALHRHEEGEPARLLSALKTEVHLWYVEPDTIDDPALLAAYDALLAPSERERNRRFVFARHRHQDLVTRALVRTVLSTYAPSVDPGAWEFAAGAFGRPEIAAPPLRPILRFNLSHTDGLIVCAVADDREVGVDVEDTRRSGYSVEIADRFFSPDEARELRSWPAERQPERFFDYWTLKEAYIKARGLGLQIPLDQFTIRLPGFEQNDRAERQIGIAFGTEIDDEPRSWQLALLDLTARHRVAVAVRHRGVDLGLRIMQTVPTPGGHPVRQGETPG
jgi:4'-phosphopantetheinyl transferase